MQSFPRAARFYILAVLFLGGVLALVSIYLLWGNWNYFLSFLGLAAAIAILDLYPVKFPVAGTDGGSATETTVSTAIKLAAVIIWPFPVAVLASFLATLLADWRLHREWYKAGFNAGAISITYFLAALVYRIASGSDTALFQTPHNVAALVALGICELILNSLLVSLVIAFVAKMPVLYIWTGNIRPVVLHELSMIPIGITIAVLYDFTPWSIPLIIIPLIVVRSSYQAVVDLSEQTRRALHALAQVLDERDEATAHHSDQVAQYAQMIARAMHLSATEVDTIVQAAWLHDIGKVGMRNDILYKQTALTSQEREVARHHATIGSELLKQFPSFSQGAVLVKHHHEWWNGEGYPDRLKGEEIPLGARILAVADAFQAMTDVRPYRRQMTEDAALDELRRNAGIQFDPKVVEVFLHEKGFDSTVTEDYLVVPDSAPAPVRPA